MNNEAKLARELVRERLFNLALLGFTNVAWFLIARKIQQDLLAVINKQNRNIEVDKKQLQYFLTRLRQEGVDIEDILDEFDFIVLRDMEPPNENPN